MPGIGITGGRFGGGGGASITVGVFSDAGATIPITSSDYGTTIYIKATTTAAQENFTLFIDNGTQSELPVVAIDNSATHVFEYTINLTGTLDIYVIASDNINGIADSEPFEFTVTSVYPPSIAENVLWIDAAKTGSETYVLNGSNVAALNDLSGLSNHLVAPTVGNEPLFLEAPLGINSLRSTQFVSGKFLNKLGFSLDIVTGNSVYIVAQFTTNTTGGLISNGNTATDGTPYFTIQQSGLGVRTYSVSVGYSATYPIALNTTYLFEVHRTTSVERFYINGVLQHTRAVGITGNRGNLYLNTGFAAQIAAKTADIAVFNGVISSGDELALRTLLIGKWGI